MKTLAKLFLVAFLGAGMLQAAAFEKVATSKATQVKMSSQKPLTTGQNTLKLSIEDTKYQDSQLSIKVFMPAMPGMPYMENESVATNLGNGEYEANVNFSMRGTWQVHIFVTPKTGKKIRAKTSINI